MSLINKERLKTLGVFAVGVAIILTSVKSGAYVGSAIRDKVKG